MATRTQLSFATCNLFNLNEPGLRIYRDTDGWSQTEYDKKIVWTGAALKSTRSDVFGFQELWHRDSLKAAIAEAGMASSYKLLVPSGQSGQKIVCAAAVRKQILLGSPEWITDFPADFRLESGGDDAQSTGIAVNISTFSRPILHFKIKPRSDGRVISVYVAHLKSKLPTAIYREPWYVKAKHSKHTEGLGAAIATIRRTAEAAAMRMILTEEMKGTDRPVVVLGDLNDSQHSNTLNILTGQPNYLLSGLSLGGSDVDLYTAGTLQEYRSLRDVYFTHIHQHFRESLDHILVSQEFYDNSKQRRWAFKGMTINNDHLKDEDHKATGTSDHAIVRAQFEYRPA
ncbi:MAG: endonuclease/exonuclease/phosphatase family protein [bacterium]|nr:endonuclease/exonuclease/phosphatase family protein [bacterium]